MSMKTSVSRLPVNGRGKEVKAHTKNIMSAIDPKWSAWSGYLAFRWSGAAPCTLHS